MGRKAVGPAIGLSVVAVAIIAAVTASGATGGGDTLSACAKNSNGELHLLAAGATCPPNSALVQWNITGPPGPQGPAGPAGPVVTVAAGAADCDVEPESAPDTTTFAKIDGIDGDSAMKGFENQVELSGVAFCVQAQQAMSGAGTGTVTVSDVRVVKVLDSASVPLLQRATTGQHIPEVTINVLRTGAGVATPVQTLVLHDVTVSALRQRAHGRLPTEAVDLHFRTLTETTRTLDAKGVPGPPVSVTYDRGQ